MGLATALLHARVGAAKKDYYIRIVENESVGLNYFAQLNISIK